MCVFVCVELLLSLSWQVFVTKPLDDFLIRFGMDQRLCFSDLWCLADTVYEDFEKNIWLAKHIKGGGAVDDSLWVEMLSTNMQKRLAKYRSNINKWQESQGIPGQNEEWAVDLDHNPTRGKTAHESRARPSQLFTFISHGTIWHESHGRPLLCLEHLLAHGIMPSKKLQKAYHQPELFDAWDMIRHGDLSPAQVRSMSGNMWHIPVFGMYIMYFLSVIELRNDHQKIKRSFVQRVDSESDEEEQATPPKRRKTRIERNVMTGVKRRDPDRVAFGMPRLSFD